MRVSSELCSNPFVYRNARYLFYLCVFRRTFNTSEVLEGSNPRRGVYTKLLPAIQSNGTLTVAHTHARVQTSTDG